MGVKKVQYGPGMKLFKFYGELKYAMFVIFWMKLHQHFFTTFGLNIAVFSSARNSVN